MKFGPSRGELWFRLVFSIAGLVLLVVAVQLRGVGGMAWVEIVGMSTLFFGGTAIWTIRKLIRRD